MAKLCLNQFNAGELSPWLAARYDLPKYQYSAKTLKNMIALTEGGIKRRGGSHFVASVKETRALLLQIFPIPSNATVVMNSEECRQLYCAKGDRVSYTVSCDGYQTKTGVITVNEDLDIEVALVSNINRCNLTINTIPEDAIVFINNIESKNLDLLAGSEIAWMVYHTGYETKSSSLILKEDTLINVNLVMKFSIIAYPKDASVKINGKTISSIEVSPGETINWEVERAGFETKTGSATITQTTAINVNLTATDYDDVVFESSQAGDYVLQVNEDGIYAIEGTGGGSGGYYKTDWNGGTGAVYKGVVALAKGLYKIAVGKGSSSAKPPANATPTTIKKDNLEILTLGGGIHRAREKNEAKISRHFYNELSVIMAQNGTSPNKGNWKTNPNALYGTTYGYGGQRNKAGGKGYLKITYKGVYIND